MMIGQTISHFAPEAYQPLADRIFEKLGEAPKLPAMRQQAAATLSIPPKVGSDT
jgi:hypothetical protein